MMSLQYVARKRMKVAGRTVEPGEVVPEAVTWKNVKGYVDNGSLAVALEVPEGTVENAELKGQVADLAERVSLLEGLLTGSGEEEGDLEVVKGQDGVSAGTDSPSDDTGTESVNTVEPIDIDALDDITRKKLDEKAIALGIEDAPKFGSKLAVATAINEAIAQREAQP